MNGTATEDTTFRLDQSTQVATDNLKSYSAGDYTLFLGNWKTGLRLYVTRYPSYAWEMRLMDSPIQNGKLQGNNDYFTYLFITKGMTFNNYVVKPMLLKGTYTIDTIPTFEQFGQKPSLNFPSEVEGTTGNVETKIQNKNYYNVNDISLSSSNITVDNEDYISFEGNNILSTNYLWKNFFTTKSKTLKPNTKYYLMLEVKEVKGTGTLHVISRSVNDISQFQEDIILKFEELTNNYKKSFEITTLSDLSLTKIKSMLRTFGEFNPGQSGSIKFRISILSEEVIASNFVYTSYQNQIYQLSLGDKILYGEDHARDYFDVKIDENLYKCTGYKKITELKLIKNWIKVILDGSINKFSQKSGSTNNNIFKFLGITSKIVRPSTNNDSILGYSNYFLCNNSANYLFLNNIEGMAIEDTGAIMIGFKKDNDITTVELANSKLEELNSLGNPVYIICKLNVPEEENITEVKLIEQFENMINNAQSYAEETNISSDAFLKIDFYKDKVLELEERLENLENK